MGIAWRLRGMATYMPTGTPFQPGSAQALTLRCVPRQRPRPQSSGPLQDWAAAWASDTVVAAHSAFKGLNFAGSGDHSWSVRFDDPDREKSKSTERKTTCQGWRSFGRITQCDLALAAILDNGLRPRGRSRSMARRSAEISQCSWARGPRETIPGAFLLSTSVLQSALTLNYGASSWHHGKPAPRRTFVAPESSLSLWAWAAAPAVAQSGACVLSPDRRNPNQRILRCGSELTITPAPGTVYRPAAAGDDGLPASVQLDSGALLIEFNSKRRHELQILTPLGGRLGAGHQMGNGGEAGRDLDPRARG